MSKKLTGTVRTTITVPADLKRRMDKVADALNWSAIASRAFEVALGEVAAKKERKNMSDVIQRLRASKQASDSESYNSGYEAGKDWARDTADIKELRNLERLRDSCTMAHEWDLCFDSDSVRSAYGPAERLAFSMRPEIDGQRDLAVEFWEMAIGDTEEAKANIDDDEFVRGFAEGALDVWDEVKGQI